MGWHASAGCISTLAVCAIWAVVTVIQVGQGPGAMQLQQGLLALLQGLGLVVLHCCHWFRHSMKVAARVFSYNLVRIERRVFQCRWWLLLKFKAGEGHCNL